MTAETAVASVGSPFAVVNAIAKRSKQLVNGAPPLVEDGNINKPAITALREIARDKVRVR